MHILIEIAQPLVDMDSWCYPVERQMAVKMVM